MKMIDDIKNVKIRGMVCPRCRKNMREIRDVYFPESKQLKAMLPFQIYDKWSGVTYESFYFYCGKCKKLFGYEKNDGSLAISPCGDKEIGYSKKLNAIVFKKM